MASKPDVMQGKQAAQDPSPLKGKWVTGTRKGQRKGGDRARKGRRCWLPPRHSQHNQHTRLLTHPEHTLTSPVIAPVWLIVRTPIGPAQRCACTHSDSAHDRRGRQTQTALLLLRRNAGRDGASSRERRDRRWRGRQSDRW